MLLAGVLAFTLDNILPGMFSLVLSTPTHFETVSFSQSGVAAFNLFKYLTFSNYLRNYCLLSLDRIQ